MRDFLLVQFLVLRLLLVRDAPDNHLVCRLAADRTGICDVLLLERHAALGIPVSSLTFSSQARSPHHMT